MPKKRKKKKMPYTYCVSMVATIRMLEKMGEFDKESWAENYWSLILSKHTLDEYRQNFDETNNPLYIWKAYSLCRHFDKPWPEYVEETMDWVMDYFDRVAKGLLREGNEPSDCAFHLGLELKGGGPSQFRQLEKANDMKYILGEVLHFLNQNKEASLEDAFYEISDDFDKIHNEPISPDTIKKWYLKMK